MSLEEAADERDDRLSGVLEHIVAAVGEAMHVSGRKAALPLVEEVPIEDEVHFAPANQQRDIDQPVELVRGPLQDFVGAARSHR